MKEEPALDAKCKDKFLVQSVAVTRDMEFANVTSIVCCSALPGRASRRKLMADNHEQFEKASKSAVIERKIRVNWLPSDATLAEQDSNRANDSVCHTSASPFAHKLTLGSGTG